MAKRIANRKVVMKDVRLSFPNLSTPTKFDPSNDKETPKYRANFILDPEEHADTIKEIKGVLSEMSIEAFGTDDYANRKINVECFGKGDNRRNQQTDEIYDGYEGKFYLSANNAKRPNLVDRDKSQLMGDEIEEKLYAGCHVQASVEFWVQNNGFGKAIRCQLRAIRFWSDDEPFGAAGVDIETEFGDDDDDDFEF